MSGTGASNDGSNLDPRWQRAMDCFDKGDSLSALRLYEALAADGEDYALAEIGNLYELGKVSQLPDFEEAARWYRKSVFQVDDPKAHLALARMHFNGQLAGTDSANAFLRHATAASERGEPSACLMLGLAFETGYLASKDPERAKTYYEQAAAGGYVLAQRQLAAFALRAGQLGTAFRAFFIALWNTARYGIRNSQDPRLVGVRRGDHKRR